MAAHSKLNSNILSNPKLRAICLGSSVASVLFLIKLYRKSRSRPVLHKSVFFKPHRKSDRSDFYAKLVKILRLLIPSWSSPEIGYMALTSAVLVFRTMLEIWRIQLDTLLESSIITMDSKRFNRNLLKFFMLMPSLALTFSVEKFFTERLAQRFRSRLTQHITSKYMQGLTFYRLSLHSNTSGIDQLIAQDISLFATTLANIQAQLSKPILEIVIYIYSLSKALGVSIPLQVVAYLVVSAGILINFRRPIARMTAMEQQLEGEYRFYHNRIITNAEEIAFYGGNQREETGLAGCFKRLMDHVEKFICFRFVVRYLESLITREGATMWAYYCISRPFFSLVPNKITEMTSKARQEYYYNAGRMMLYMCLAIGRLVHNGKELTKLAGYTSRVHGLMTTLDTPVETAVSPAGAIVHRDGLINFKRVPIVTPNGDVLIKELNLSIQPGQNILISGPNGCGKSSLFRILGELWPLKSGVLTKPENCKLFYVPQRPYMTVGTLRDQIIYPDSEAIMKSRGISDGDIVELLSKVKLEWIVEQGEDVNESEENGIMGKRRSLDDVENWIDVLSGGQKQRIAMARLLYHRPQFAILDECTSAVSMDVEAAIYNYCREVGITLITVTHRKSLWKHHEYVLLMDGRGNYEMKRITKAMEEQ